MIAMPHERTGLGIALVIAEPDATRVAHVPVERYSGDLEDSLVGRGRDRHAGRAVLGSPGVGRRVLGDGRRLGGRHLGARDGLPRLVTGKKMRGPVGPLIFLG